jgi:uncharacterized protein YlxP (DUF503 family)
MKFFIGIGRYQLDMASCESLKDKRRFVKSIVDRLGNSKVIAISEVGNNDYWKSGTLALSCVSASREVVQNTLDRAVKTIEGYGVEVVRADSWILNPEDLEENL